jgi:acyl carrier protein
LLAPGGALRRKWAVRPVSGAQPPFPAGDIAMTRDEIKQKVVDIICNRFEDHPRANVKDETAFIEDLGADSLDIAEMVMEFEDEFDISIPEDEQGIKTVGDAVNYIEKHVAKAD